MKLKYIVVKTEQGKELPFVFSADITHADFLSGVEMIPTGYWASHGQNYNRTLRGVECIAGGFFNGLICYGESESLRVKTRGAIDSALLGIRSEP